MDLTGRSLMLPNWGDISQRLVVASLRREGIDAYLLEERRVSIQKSLRLDFGMELCQNQII